jgi:hypothetical protein
MKLLPPWWRRHFLFCEGLVAVAIAALFGWWYIRQSGDLTINALLKGYRQSIYGTAASILGSLLGFIITAASIVFAVSGSDRLSVIRDSAQYPTLWLVFSSTIRALALGTAVSFVALIFDRDDKPASWLLILTVYTVALAVLRIARAIWALENVIWLITAPSKASRANPP